MLPRRRRQRQSDQRQNTVRVAPPTATPVIVGKGNYEIGSGIGRAVGNLVPIPGAGAIGAMLGGKIGEWASDLIGKIRGRGDYTVGPLPATNTLLYQNQVPRFAGGSTAVRVCHREFIGNVVSAAIAGAFENVAYALNAANQGFFPWLANIARHFQQYRFNGLALEFRTTSGQLAGTTSTALGEVMFATDYDADHEPFQTKVELLNSEFASSCVTSANMIHGVECAQPQTPTRLLYTRSETEAVPDRRFSDLGTFQVATNGCPFASQVLGELWATYDVELYKPELAHDDVADGFVYHSDVLGDQNPWGTPGVPVFDVGGMEVLVGPAAYPQQLTITFPRVGTYLMGYAAHETNGQPLSFSGSFPTVASGPATTSIYVDNGVSSGGVYAQAQWLVNVTAIEPVVLNADFFDQWSPSAGTCAVLAGFIA